MLKMKQLCFLFIVFLLLISTIETSSSSSRRRRRQNNGYNLVQQYGNQYGLYGPGGQGWVNNYDNRYPNPNYAWNNNFNWNQGNRRPEWYYNSARGIKPSMVVFLFAGIFFHLL